MKKPLKVFALILLLCSLVLICFCGCMKNGSAAKVSEESFQTSESQTVQVGVSNTTTETMASNDDTISPEFEEYLKDYDSFGFEDGRDPITEDQLQAVLNSSKAVIINYSDIPESYDFDNDISPRRFELCENKMLILPEIITTGSEGDYQYVIHKGGTLEITKYLGNDENVVIPNKIAGYPVSYIGEFAFAECDMKTVSPNEILTRTIRTVKIPNTVIAIGGEAFFGCSKIEKVELSNNLNCIGICAFMFCNSLKEINFPTSLEVIGMEAFSNTGLTRVTIPSTVKYIDVGAFGDCTNLNNIEFQGGDMHIGGSIIHNTAVDNVYIPANLTLNKSLALFSPSNLKKVEYASKMDEDTEVYAEMYKDCQKLEEIKLPENTRKIGEYAFQNCRSLKEIHIPAAVQQIDTWAFTQCYSLGDVYFGSADCAGLDEAGFAGQIRNIHAPAGGTIEKYCKMHPLLRFIAVG